MKRLPRGRGATALGAPAPRLFGTEMAVSKFGIFYRDAGVLGVLVGQVSARLWEGRLLLSGKELRMVTAATSRGVTNQLERMLLKLLGAAKLMAYGYPGKESESK